MIRRFPSLGAGEVAFAGRGPGWCPRPYTEGHTVLAAGASVLLYTHGLVERRGEVIDDGLDRLAAAAAAHLHAAPEDLIGILLDAGLVGAGPPTMSH